MGCLSDVEFDAESNGTNRIVVAQCGSELWPFESEILADLGFFGYDRVSFWFG